jgi:hypothetical protein
MLNGKIALENMREHEVAGESKVNAEKMWRVCYSLLKCE